MRKKINLNPYFIISYLQITVRCKSEIFSSLEENIEENRCDLEGPKKINYQKKSDKLDFIKTKNFYSTRKNHEDNKQANHKLSEKLDKSDKGPVYRIHKELSQLNTKKQKHQ